MVMGKKGRSDDLPRELIWLRLFSAHYPVRPALHAFQRINSIKKTIQKICLLRPLSGQACSPRLPKNKYYIEDNPKICFLRPLSGPACFPRLPKNKYYKEDNPKICAS
jgi:hypothetical protein